MSEYKDALNGIIKAMSIFSKRLLPYKNWFDENIDNISLLLSGISNFATWSAAIDKLAKVQIVFTDDLNFEFARIINNSNDVENEIKHYYFDNSYEKMNNLIQRCKDSELLQDYASFFYEIMNSYNNEDYQLACLGLFAIIDGLLTDISNLNKTNYKVRIKTITDKIDKRLPLNQLDRKLLCIYQSINSNEVFNNSILGNADLNKKEPDNLNRHWLLHGRTNKKYTRYDCLKIFLWIEALIILNDNLEKVET